MASDVLDDEALCTFCRAQGVFVNHLETWKQDFIRSLKDQAPSDRLLARGKQTTAKRLKSKGKSLGGRSGFAGAAKKFQAFRAEKAS
jgi:hypothetical protein